MANNDVILVQEMIERNRRETEMLSISEQDAYFFARHYLHPFSPSHDDLLAGLVDGSGDGGIDGVYILVNGMFVRDDAPLWGMGRGVNLQLVLTQVKNVRGFSEGAVERLIVHIPELLSFDRNEKELAKTFNSRVIEITRRFLDVVRDLDMPQIEIYSAFASLKSDSPAHPNVLRKCDRLSSVYTECFGASSPTVECHDAASVYELAGYRTPTTKRLLLAENPISTDVVGGYIGVATLDEYNRFITDETGRLDTAMFDANVRDYESGSGVNESIQQTLRSTESDVDFWWLNNGVTIVAEQVQPAGKQLTLSTPQVVNGLQTSHEIYKRTSRSELLDARSVLVKVVQIANEATKDRIIKATNSQTALGTSTLRATDQVQRKVEDYFGSIGLFYERRKNFYRNQQIPLDVLVSIEQLGQALTSTLVQTPHVARGEVSRIFEDEIYDLLFHGSHPLEVYSQSITILRMCEKFLRQESSTRGEVDNFVFHLATLTAIVMTRKLNPSAKDLASIDRVPGTELLSALLPTVRQTFSEVVNSKDYVLFDQVAKDSLSTSKLLAGADVYLRSPRTLK